MNTLISAALEPVIPTEEDARLAGEALRTLAPLLEGPDIDGGILLRIRSEDGREKEVEMPPSSLPLLVGILKQLVEGSGFALLALSSEPACRRSVRDIEKRRRLNALSEAVEEAGVYDRFVQEEASPA